MVKKKAQSRIDWQDEQKKILPYRWVNISGYTWSGGGRETHLRFTESLWIIETPRLKAHVKIHLYYDTSYAHQSRAAVYEWGQTGWRPLAEIPWQHMAGVRGEFQNLRGEIDEDTETLLDIAYKFLIPDYGNESVNPLYKV